MASGIMGIMPWDYPWAIGNNQNEIVLRTISPILQSPSNPEKCWACSAHGEVSGSWGHWTPLQDEAQIRDFQPKAVIFSLDFYEMPIWFLWDANLDVLAGPWHTENRSEQQPIFFQVGLIHLPLKLKDRSPLPSMGFVSGPVIRRHPKCIENWLREVWKQHISKILCCWHCH